MNMPSTTSQMPANAEVRPREALRDADPRDVQQQRDAFEQLLRSKQAQFDESDGKDEDVAADAGAGGLLVCAAPALQAARPPNTQHACAAVETEKTGARAAIEAALTHSTPAVAPVGGTDPAAVWEASVREANSVPLEMRFMRAEKAPNEAQPGWTLTVGSSGVNAEALVRHAPRLNERLRKHGVGLDHVRIQRDEGDA